MSNVQERLLRGIEMLTAAFRADYITEPADDAGERQDQLAQYQAALTRAFGELQGVADDAEYGDFPVETAAAVAALLGDVARTLSHVSSRR